ncbi:MAG: hypothetical protein ACYTGV_01215 [Planctomycetota bacterium]|jgi:predicted  nucleic acid-binding Zn-ribbon protein
MARVCAHCGKMYPEERINCPHCGADADLTYVEDPPWMADPRTEEEVYEEFLEQEGLAEPKHRPKPGSRRGGCALVLAGGTISGLIWLLI